MLSGTKDMTKLNTMIGILTTLTSLTVSAVEPSSQVAWTPETMKLVKQGNSQKGKMIAESCDTCHAATAEATSDIPYLQGQNAAYLFKQLKDYKSGNRVNAIMVGMAAGLSNQDMADLAAWYSQQPIPSSSTVTASAAAGDVAKLVERGDPRRILPPCTVCHAEDGQGKSIDNPALAGQRAAYLENALLAYQSGSRHNDVYQRMRLIAKTLSRDEIHQLASYYASRKP